MTGSKTANYVYAAPNGSAGSPSFRKLVAADIPNLAASKITSGTLSSSRLPISTTQTNSTTKVPSSSLVYSMNQKITELDNAIAGTSGVIVQLSLPVGAFSIIETTSDDVGLFGISFPLNTGFDIWKVQVTWQHDDIEFGGKYSAATYGQTLNADIQSLELNRGSEYEFTDISGTMMAPYICLSLDGSSIILKNKVTKTMKSWTCYTASTINVKCFS